MTNVWPLESPLRNILRIGVDLLLPPRCPGCRVIVATDHSFCSDCWPKLRFITTPQCVRCGTPFEHDMGPGAECAVCLADPPRYARARAPLVYDGPARTVLMGLKHGDRLHLARLMALHMARAGAPLLTPQSLLVPVPLHWQRLWSRGYNQAALLAQDLARISGAALAIDALVRTKPTPSSAGMGREARIANVRGVFRVQQRERIAGRRIVLIDDVLTSGATANACARLLRRAGAASVDVLTFARAVREGDAMRSPGVFLAAERE